MTVARAAPVFVLFVVLSAVAPAVGGGQVPSPADRPGPAAAVVDGPRFVDPPYREHRGDVVRVPVAVSNGSAATVTLRGNGTEYAATVTLRDGSGDGRATLLWNTYAAAGSVAEAAFGTAAPGDAVTNRSGTAADGIPPTGAYDLAVVPADDAVNGTDATTLRLERAGPVELSVLRAAPDAVDALAVARDVVAKRRTATLSRARADDGHRLVGLGEVTILALRAPGLAGPLAAADGPNATARLRSLLGSELSVRVAENLETVHAHEDPVVYRLRNAEWLRTVPDPDDDTYYVALGSPEAVHAGGLVEAAPPEVDARDGFRFEVTVGAAREVAAVANVSVRFVRTDGVGLLTTEGGRLPPGTANGTIVGRTTLRSAQRVTVVLRSPAGDPFPLRQRVAVDPDGRFRARFDLGGVPPGTTFEAVVRYGNRTVDTAPGVVGPAARVRFADRAVLLEYVDSIAVDSVFVTHPSFVALHLGSAGGPVVGVSDHVWADTRSDVEVPVRRDLDGNVTLVAVAHHDRDGDRVFDPDVDTVYGAGSPAAAARVVDIDGTATPTPSSTPGSTVAGSPTGTHSGDGAVPGFGPVVAVVALAVAVAGARSGGRSRGGGRS